MKIAIEARGLRKVYGRKVEALRGIDLDVPKGCCFGLLGPNGAGKSTLVKTLLGIVRPTAGTALLDGVDFRSPSARKSVGYLPEGHAFPPYLTGRGVCLYFGRLAGLRGKELEREVDEKLEAVGMADRADARVTQCSKGMKQRIGLAQALLGAPKLIFLDEPTDGLDPVGRAEVRDVIRAAVDKGATVFFNSHLLSEVEVLCDELAIMRAGELVERGNLGQIKASVNAAKGEGNKLVVDLETGDVPEATWTQLAAEGASRVEGGMRVSLAKREEIPALIDTLRAASVPIYAVRPKQQSLEDAFISLLQGGEPEGGAPVEAPSADKEASS